jgi:hypothetical protein
MTRRPRPVFVVHIRTDLVCRIKHGSSFSINRRRQITQHLLGFYCALPLDTGNALLGAFGSFSFNNF